MSCIDLDRNVCVAIQEVFSWDANIIEVKATVIDSVQSALQTVILATNAG